MSTPAHVDAFRKDGVAIVRGVFDTAEVAEIAAAFDRVRAEGLSHPKSFRHGNRFFRQATDPRLGRILRFAQWPSYVDPVLDQVRKDPRMLAIVAPLIGHDLKQIINQLHWKPPGAAMAEFGWHQDIRFRRPRSAYRDPGESYVQSGIAVDPHRIENGAMRFVPGSHRLGELPLGDGRVMDRPLQDDDLVHAGLDPRAAVTIDLEPGDVALWNLFTLHGSGPNLSGADPRGDDRPGIERQGIDRRLYINGYVRASSCDRGEWTFRDGRPVPLGDPVLVHWEDLHLRPEPHYVDD